MDELQWNDAAILGAAPIIRKIVDALVDIEPSLSRFKLFVSAFFSLLVVGTLLIPEPYQTYIKMTFALIFATAFYNDWYKSRKSNINVENIGKVSVGKDTEMSPE